MNAFVSNDFKSLSGPIDFLWLELTNRCNLQCTHCYAESGPHAGHDDILTASDYERTLQDAFVLGCRKVQFIGGEPTLNNDLAYLINKASEIGFTFIEIYTNLTRLSDDLISCIKLNHVHIATSVYSYDSSVHDAITKSKGSFERTISHAKKLLVLDVDVRAAVIEMPANAGQINDTVNYLHETGIKNVGTDRLRNFGRGGSSDDCSGIEELCGNCATGTVCVSPDGRVSPCVMSKKWAVGSLTQSSLHDLVTGPSLQAIRDKIFDTVVAPNLEATLEVTGVCSPCQPHGGGCTPCSPMSSCSPTTCSPY